jgi:hypothetical protein
VEAYYVLLPVAVTSLLLFVVATRRLGARKGALRPAVGRMVELVGLAIVLAIANLAAGFVLVLALRRLTGSFVSMYLNADGTLIALAVLQAVVLQWWLRDGE